MTIRIEPAKSSSSAVVGISQKKSIFLYWTVSVYFIKFPKCEHSQDSNTECKAN